MKKEVFINNRANAALSFAAQGQPVICFRTLTVFVLICVFLSMIFVQITQAYAGVLRDIPDFIKLRSTQAVAMPSLDIYPALFGSGETSSSQLAAFTKWSDMFARFEQQLMAHGGQIAPEIAALQADLKEIDGQSLASMARAVNRLMNARPYITDDRNWGMTDYWETPLEFLQRGGDCEDFAIAKYTALRMLGVSEQRLRIAVVQDTFKNIPHAVLVVYTDEGTLILDNQNKKALNGDEAGRYRPIFSINRQAWWLHKDPSATRVASAY